MQTRMSSYIIKAHSSHNHSDCVHTRYIKNLSPSVDSEEDVQSWYSLGGQRVIQTINVKSFKEDTYSSNKQRKNNGNRRYPSYACLTSHTAVHNTLLTVGIGRKSLVQHNKSIAASKIQSLIRRFLVRRRIRNSVNYLKEMKNILIEDSLKSKGCNPKSILSTSKYYRQYETKFIQELNELTNICMNPFTEEYHIKRILRLFFDLCSSNNKYLQKTEFTVLICDILKLPLSKDEVINYILSSKHFPVHGMINFNQLCKWFLSYRHKHKHDKVCYLRRLFDKWFTDPLPENIVLKYIDIRASLFDVCITSMVFDLKHSCCSLFIRH